MPPCTHKHPLGAACRTALNVESTMGEIKMNEIYVFCDELIPYKSFAISSIKAPIIKCADVAQSRSDA